MKTQLVQLALLVSFGYVLCAVLFISCNVLSSEKLPDLLELRSYGLQAHEKARVSYEAETVTVTLYEGDVPHHLKEQYTLRSIPAVNRSRVQVSIDRAGPVHWVIEDLEPERKIPDGRHDIPPDLSPKVKRTVIHDHQADFYDASGKLIRSGRIDMPDLAQINEFLKNAGGQNRDLKQRLAFAKQNGSIIYEHPNGNLTIRTRQRLSDLYSRGGPAQAPEVPSEEVEMRELVDTKRNVIVATALCDPSGAVLEESLLKYRHGGTELQHIHSVSTATDRNHVKVKSITDTYFDYLNVIISDN